MKLALLCSVAISVGGCQVVSSYRDPIDHPSEIPHQAGGTYHLPKQLVQIQVRTDKAFSSATQSVEINKTLSTSVVTVPDHSTQMVVGFDLSPLSDDNIQVDYENGLLKQVSAVATDRTGDIAVALAKDAGLFRDAPFASAQTIKTFQFDPFDDAQAKAVNNQLGPGSCVEVELRPGWWSRGCEGITKRRSNRTGWAGSNEQLAAGNVYAGIYYRTAVPRTVHAVLKGTTFETKQLMFANNEPIRKLDIDRTSFVTRETKVTFNSGELASVLVKKESEALAVAKLPAQIVGAYVGSVLEGITQRSQVQTATANLLNAQATVENAKVSLLKAQVQSSQAVSGSNFLSADYAARNGNYSPQRDGDYSSQQGVDSLKVRCIDIRLQGPC